MISPPTEQELLQVLDKFEQEHKRGWNEAIEAAAVIADVLGKDYDVKLEVGPNVVAVAPLQEGGSIASHALAAAIRKLKKP